MPHVPRNIQGGYTATDFWNQWESDTPRMALLVKITSKAEFGSVVRGFTTNTRNMTMPGHPGVTFYSTPGMSPTIVEQALDEAPTMELSGAYIAGIITQAEVTAGKWRGASVEIFSTCWDNVNLGELLHFKGVIGEIRDYQTYFTCEGRGLISKLSQEIDKVTQRLCRVKEFRDSECGHTASTVVIGGTTYNVVQTGIQAWSGGDVIVLQTLGFAGNVPPANFYDNGKMLCTGGANSGIGREITFNAAAGGGLMSFELKRAFPFTVSFGDTFTLTAGCNRTIEDCMKFTNITRRRAEDWIPGIESANRLPTTI